MINSMMQGNQSFAQTTRQVLLQVVSEFIAARIKIEFDWLAGRAAMMFGDQAWAKASVLQTIFGANEIDAVQQQSFDKFLVDEGARVGATLESQTAQTGAVVEGTAVRSTVQDTGASAGLAIQAAAGHSSIMNDAHIAYTNTYAAVSEIPVVGPFLAPAAADAAYAAVMAYDVLTSAEGGDPMVAAGLYQLHEREMVMPQGIADPMREFFAGTAARNFDGSLDGAAGNIAKSIAGLSTRPIDVSGGLGGSTQANLASRITVPHTQEQIEAALLSVNARTGGALAGGGAARGGDNYTINAIDAASFRQFLARADTRRALKQSAQDTVRGGAGGRSA